MSGRLLLSILALALAACDNNPAPAPWKKNRPDGSPWLTSVRAFPDDPRSLDPQFTYDEVSHRVVASVYDTLLTYEPFRTEFVLTPAMADAMPEPRSNPDGTIDLICRIKPGRFFQDDPCFPDGKGREVTSQDFVYAFQRMSDPKVECPIASTLQEKIAGMKAAWDAADKAGRFDYDAPFAPVEAVDRYTFRIRLLGPYPQINYWLAVPFTAPVAREAVQFYDGRVHDGRQRELFKFHPVGTGAFRIAEWQRGRLIRLVRNDTYPDRFPASGWTKHPDRYTPHIGKPLPLLDEFQLLIMRESIPAWILFKQGWTDASIVSKDTFNSVVGGKGLLTPEYEARGIELEKDVEPATWYIMFNMQDPVIGSNQKLRQAISLAFDPAIANRIFFNGTYRITRDLIPPGIFGSEPDEIGGDAQVRLAQARQLLADAGYPNGIDPKTKRRLELTLDAQADDGLTRQMTEFEKSQFEQLGIHVNIRENIFAQMIDRQTRGTYQFVFAGWNADYPDPENFFFLFYGPNMPPRGYNQSRYNNPEFNRLFEQMTVMTNTPERAAIVSRMTEILRADSAIAPVWNPTKYVLLQPWAKRIVRNSIVANSSGLKYAWVDVPMREIEQQKLNAKNYWPLAVAGLLLAAVVGWGIRQRSQANV